jgi:hypothetical protein
MTVWIYDQGEELKVFATDEDAKDWLDDNDPEGVAFEYEVIGRSRNDLEGLAPCQSAGAQELAEQTIDNMAADIAEATKDKLLEGPEEFRRIRRDRAEGEEEAK